MLNVSLVYLPCFRALIKQETFPPWIQRDLQFIHLEFQKLVYLPGIHLSHNITGITAIIISSFYDLISIPKSVVIYIFQGTYHALFLPLEALSFIRGHHNT